MFGFVLDSETITTGVLSVEQGIEVHASSGRSVWLSSSAFVESRYAEFCFPVCETKIT
jgi:hypothetical protein